MIDKHLQSDAIRFMDELDERVAAICKKSRVFVWDNTEYEELRDNLKADIMYFINSGCFAGVAEDSPGFSKEAFAHEMIDKSAKKYHNSVIAYPNR